MYHCRFCVATFSQPRLLRDHEDRHRRVYPCLKCGRQFATRFSLYKHTKRSGHYLKDAKRLPTNHHIPYKGARPLSAVEFGRTTAHTLPPTQPRAEVLERPEINQIYQPRLPADERTVDCSSDLRTRIPRKRRRDDSPGPSSRYQSPPRPPPSTHSKKGKALAKGRATPKQTGANFKRGEKSESEDSPDEFDLAGTRDTESDFSD